MNKKAFFVTGTDTSVGKTIVCAGLLVAAKNRGLTTAALKPVAAGSEKTAEGLRNDDAVLLQSVITEKLYYEQINPYALIEPIAPHLAAQHEKRNLTVDRVSGFCRGVLSSAEFTLVEGAGGWRVPLNARETMADVVKNLQLPVILVVGVRLGCLNHALLSVEAILRDGLPLAGWVANCVDKDMLALQENIESLTARIPAPCLGTIPFLSDISPESAAQYFDEKAFDHLLK